MIDSHFQQYLIDQDKAELTCKNYLRDISQFSQWFYQTNGYELSPESLTATDVREYRQFLQVTEQAAPATINRRLAAIRAYADWAQHAGLIDHNPLQSIRGVREQETAPRWLDRRELARLERELERRRSAAKTPTARGLALRNRVIFVVLVNTGLRISELCALELGDIELSERKGSVRVRAGKGEKARTIPLNRPARQALVEWLQNRSTTGNSLVFSGISARSIQRELAELARINGIEVTPHTLRHTFAKSLVDAGVSLEKVAMLLGHSSLDTTRIYTTPGKADLERAVGLLED